MPYAAATLPAPLTGIIPPMITPLADRDALDAPGLERLIEHLIDGGVQGLFILGTTGEGPSLSYRLRAELIAQTCTQVAGRLPVLVGVTDTSFVESVRMAHVAADRGAAAVVLAAPYYLPPSQVELCGYVERIIEELPLPLFLYNMPTLTKVAFEPETLARLFEHPQIVGLKDSSGDLLYLEQAIRITRQRANFSVLVGPEQLLVEAIAMGAHGGVCGGANLFPQRFVELFRATRDGDSERLHSLQERMAELRQLYSIGRDGTAFIKGLKTALACRNICNDAMAEPFRQFDAAERRRVAQLLAELDAG